MNEFDPTAWGRVLQRLDEQDAGTRRAEVLLSETKRQTEKTLEKQNDEIREVKEDIKTLLAMANQGKGGLMMLMTIGTLVGTLVGGLVGWIAERFWR